MIDFSKAQFLTSASQLQGCPTDVGTEIAFCGRSNAGKSSAINTLTRQKKLARTSKTPGRTQLINFFSLSADTRLVDLPGFGYARVPTSIKQHWHKHLDEYLRARSSLRGLVLLMDIRHPLKPFDETMINWCADAALPLHILLTKADKLKRGAQQNTLLSLTRSLPINVTVQIFSAQNGLGLTEFENTLQTWMHLAVLREENEC